jgi:rubrerythrin
MKMKNVFSDMLKDEKYAPRDYHKLLKKMKTKRERKVIRSIIRDEKKHYKLLNKLRKARL